MKKEITFGSRSVSTVLTALVLTMLFAGAVFAQTTAFTYQGRLNDGVQAASGTYDLQFALFDAESNGTQIGTTTTRSNVTVSNGVFSVSLDFGASPFAAGANRFLQIAVKKTSETNYTTLTPRQPLTSSPYSIRTLSATAADSLSANCVGCVTNAQINSIDGAKVTGTVANANTANSATTATTANNVSGVVAVVNGGTGSSTRNFVDLSTNQTITGNKTFNGTLNGTGISNLVRVVTFGNGATGSIPGNTDAYVFAGATTTVTIAANQRMTGAATGVFGKTTADTGSAAISLCYQLNSTGTISDFTPTTFNLVQFTTTKLSYSATASVFGLAAGTYRVGLCIRNYGSTAINNNDFINGWVMVTNN